MEHNDNYWREKQNEYLLHSHPKILREEVETTKLQLYSTKEVPMSLRIRVHRIPRTFHGCGWRHLITGINEFPGPSQSWGHVTYLITEPGFLVLLCVWRKPLVWPKPVLTCGHPQSASVYLCYSSSLSPTLNSQLVCLQNSFVTIQHNHHWLKS